MNNPFNEEEVRPAFLTVLCILTFIGSGLTILSSIVSVFTTKVLSGSGFTNMLYESLNQSDEEIPDKVVGIIDSAAEMAQKAIEYGTAIGITNLLLSVLAIVGAILMYRLNKKGFYLYALSQVLLILVSPVFIGFNYLILVGMFFALIWNGLFVLMYGLNLKHMR